ncbi:Conserved hypothetical protein [Prochlorococcus marinus str. MIT 9313]|uniref:Uncharacterized protein n=1 Tax=Prochlorococcus marinus (strain MIT 9313) TaxID=74547 RepID=B9ES76_PROMM|nr:Conserved hypothetical protein [Prochlorococcus marinus str. MIT 9313]
MALGFRSSLNQRAVACVMWLRGNHLASVDEKALTIELGLPT